MKAHSPIFSMGCALALVLCAPAFGQNSPLTPRLDTPSGDPVPRFMSLRYDEVNGRRGPGFDYQIRWLYIREDLPVQVVAETSFWRKVRDPDGDEVWMHERMLAPKRTVIVSQTLSEPTALHAHPHADSAIVAKAEPGVIFALDRCEELWCRVDSQHFAGWTLSSDLWGVEPAPGAAVGADDGKEDGPPSRASLAAVLRPVR